MTGHICKFAWKEKTSLKGDLFIDSDWEPLSEMIIEATLAIERKFLRKQWRNQKKFFYCNNILLCAEK